MAATAALPLGVVAFNVIWLLHYGPVLTARYLKGSPVSYLAAGTALLGSGVVYWSTLFQLQGFLPAGVALFSIGWISWLSDIRSRMLPNAITALMASETLVALLIATAGGSTGFGVWLAGVLGAMAWTGAIGLGWRLKQMGMGDLKLAPVVGFILGTMSLTTAMFGLFLAFIAAGIQGTVAKTYMRKVRRIPFGPSMLGASMVAWILASLGTPSQWALGT